MVKGILRLARENWRLILFFGLIYVVLFANSLHNSYPDEFDNIFGGYLVNYGFLPYKGFFSHHGPVSYFLAAILTFFTRQSFVAFRVLTSVFFLAFLVTSYVLLRRNIKKTNVNFFLLYSFILAVASTYFWGNMFLADAISGYLIIPAYSLLFLKIYQNEKLRKADFVIISLFSSLSLLNSITYIYAVAILVFVCFLYYVKSSKIQVFARESFRKILPFVWVFLAPYLVFLVYLLVTGSLSDYFFQAIIYNKNYYIYNYPRPPGTTFINPVRYAIVILNNFINAYQPLFSGIKDFTLMQPFNVTLALTNLFVWVFLIFRRKYLLFFLAFSLSVYSNVRSNPLTSQVTDYQASVYFMLTFFNASFLFFMFKEEIVFLKDQVSKLILFALFLFFSIYWFYNIVFLFSEFWRMTYSRYMGTMPLIYDRPQVAKIVNAVVSKDKYCWVGPFYFEELLYLSCKLPSRYHWILPQFTNVDKIKKELFQDYEKNKADIIVYKRGFAALGAGPEYNKFFTDFLDRKYLKLIDIEPEKHYRFKSHDSQDFVFDDDFNFEKSKAKELVKALVEKGYVEPHEK